MIITIDGPAASGKSTTARAVAQRLGFDYLDTGALYRAITLAALRGGLSPESGPEISAFLDELKLRYQYRMGEVTIWLDEEDISEPIRTSEVTAAVSAYSALPELRTHMQAFQRKFAQGRNLITEGRDMGSVVFPAAELKVFLVSDPRARAERRVKDFAAQGREVDVETVLAEINARDSFDSERDHSPLVEPEGAVLLDNSALSIEEQVEQVVKLADAARPDARVDPDDLLYEHEVGAKRRLHGMRVPFWLAWSFCRLISRLLFGLRYHHLERNIRSGPLLIASNHISWLDPPVAGTIVEREMSFVAKKELFKFRPVGSFLSYFNAIPIRRGTFDRGCFDKLRTRVKEGGAVFFFPEGTRKPVGRLGKAKFGIGLIAQETGAPVLPIFIKGSTRPWRAFLRIERVEVYMGRALHIAPLEGRGLENREILELFGEAVMREIGNLQDEALGRRL